jgi:hypothetical protein
MLEDQMLELKWTPDEGLFLVGDLLESILQAECNLPIVIYTLRIIVA